MGKTVGKTYPKKNRGGKAQTPPAQTPPAQTPPAQTSPENGANQGENKQ
jgi:hypothetical protein